MAVQLLYNEDLLVVCYHWKVKLWIILSFRDLPYHGANLVTFWPLKVTNILLFLAISPLNQMLRSAEQREWSPTWGGSLLWKQVLLVSTWRNVWRTVWRLCILILGFTVIEFQLEWVIWSWLEVLQNQCQIITLKTN